MLPDTANDIVCRLGNAVFRERTHGLIHRSDFDGTYNMQYCDGGCCIRRLAGNRVVVMINVPFIVGVRYERRFRYFEKKTWRELYSLQADDYLCGRGGRAHCSDTRAHGAVAREGQRGIMILLNSSLASAKSKLLRSGPSEKSQRPRTSACRRAFEGGLAELV